MRRLGKIKLKIKETLFQRLSLLLSNYFNLFIQLQHLQFVHSICLFEWLFSYLNVVDEINLEHVLSAKSLSCVTIITPFPISEISFIKLPTVS